MPENRGSAPADPVGLLQALVATPSVNPTLEAGGAGEGAVAMLCAGWLREWGFDVEVFEPEPGRPSVVARHGAGTPRLLFNGHLDTVGVEGMTVPPFAAVLDGEVLRGRGACDMKGGVASLLAAARALAEEGHDGTLMVALTADEEHASIGMADLVARGVSADAAVVCEPTSLAVMPAHKGFVWADVTVAGRAAHGSRPEVGIDAIRRAARFLVEIDALDAELAARDPHPLLGHGSIHAGTIRGGSAPSVYPAECVVSLERRTLPGETVDQVMAELDAVARRTRLRHPDLEVTVAATLERPGTEVASDHPLVAGLLDAVESISHTARVGPMTAWVDAAFLNEAGIPAVCFGPGSIEHAHAADEWIDTAEVRACAEILTLFGRRYLAGLSG